ncbi:hypothetical protein RI129_009143 [Pyrocoelia pectoralis]|uniref:Uncharacterized protein n=1 Tax=Pyrocoelia pectoralis TaxID=417401 RepID=A0AAN7VDA0_9COLE
MSGDSPNTHTKDYLDFKEGRSTPPPTTSKDVVVQNNVGEECKPEILAASVILEPLKNKELCYIDVGDEHLPHKKNDDIITPEDKNVRSDLKDEGDRKGLNGMIDQIDGNLLPPPALEKEDSDAENNNCVVNCLYYSLQCCECNIM